MPPQAHQQPPTQPQRVEQLVRTIRREVDQQQRQTTHRFHLGVRGLPQQQVMRQVDETLAAEGRREAVQVEAELADPGTGPPTLVLEVARANPARPAHQEDQEVREAVESARRAILLILERINLLLETLRQPAIHTLF